MRTHKWNAETRIYSVFFSAGMTVLFCPHKKHKCIFMDQSVTGTETVEEHRLHHSYMKSKHATCPHSACCCWATTPSSSIPSPWWKPSPGIVAALVPAEWCPSQLPEATNEKGEWAARAKHNGVNFYCVGASAAVQQSAVQIRRAGDDALPGHLKGTVHPLAPMLMESLS